MLRRPPAPEEQAARRGAAGAAPGHPLQVLEDPPPGGPPALRPPHRAPHGTAHPQPHPRGGAGDVADKGPQADLAALRDLGPAVARADAARRSATSASRLPQRCSRPAPPRAARRAPLPPPPAPL